MTINTNSNLKFENLETKKYYLQTVPSRGVFVAINKEEPTKPALVGDVAMYRLLKSLYLQKREKFDRAVRIRTGFQIKHDYKNDQ